MQAPHSPSAQHSLAPGQLQPSPDHLEKRRGRADPDRSPGAIHRQCDRRLDGAHVAALSSLGCCLKGSSRVHVEHGSPVFGTGTHVGDRAGDGEQPGPAVVGGELIERRLSQERRRSDRSEPKACPSRRVQGAGEAHRRQIDAAPASHPGEGRADGRGRNRELDRGDDLSPPQDGRARPGEELLDRDRPGGIGAGCDHGGPIGEKGRGSVRSRRGVAEIPGQCGPVADLDGTDDRGSLRQRRKMPAHVFVSGQPAHHHATPDPEPVTFDLDPVGDIGHRLQVDHQGRTHRPMTKRHQQVGASGQRHRIILAKQIGCLAQALRAGDIRTKSPDDHTPVRS